MNFKTINSVDDSAEDATGKWEIRYSVHLWNEPCLVTSKNTWILVLSIHNNLLLQRLSVQKNRYTHLYSEQSNSQVHFQKSSIFHRCISAISLTNFIRLWTYGRMMPSKFTSASEVAVTPSNIYYWRQIYGKVHREESHFLSSYTSNL